MSCDSLTQIKLVPPYPAILLKEGTNQALVISDIHIGWERLLSQKGVHLPSQTLKFKTMIHKLIKETKPTHLMILGDIKDAITKISMEEWKDIPEFFEDIQKKVNEIQVVIGNHDGNIEPLLPEKIKIIPPTGTVFGDVGLLHGHAWPAPELLQCRSIIIGHIHPTVAIHDPMGFRVTKQVFVKACCNTERLARSILKTSNNVFKKQDNIELSVSQLLILPTFNQFLGGRPINEEKKERNKNKTFIGPIFRSGCVNIDTAEVYLLDGTYLGTVEQLKTLS